MLLILFMIVIRCCISIRSTCILVCCFFFFQAEDGIRDAQESRGLGDVYKRQTLWTVSTMLYWPTLPLITVPMPTPPSKSCSCVLPLFSMPPLSSTTLMPAYVCLLYTSPSPRDS
eukprot:TRINITY_DN25216_c0_g1_i2.p1 TRINITY_DN25216_c0_g1~~TRINITY_DN25216_c0_g1_i2.p1  ORF type:complete len:115 (+),score=16.97 TRINITY_DN25216_c0_g1_i2:18-362(+)